MCSFKMNVSILILVIIIITTAVYVDTYNLRQTSSEMDSTSYRNRNWTISNYIQKIPKKNFKSFTTLPPILTVKYKIENWNETTERVRINNNATLIISANIIKTPSVKLKCPNGKILSANGQCIDVFLED